MALCNVFHVKEDMFSAEQVFRDRFIKQVLLVTNNNELMKDVIYHHHYHHHHDSSAYISSFV